MILILCLDKDYGMMFNHRRLSQDKNVMLDISQMIKEDKIYMNSYSYELYKNLNCQNIIVSEELNKDDGYCLIENQTITKLDEFIDAVVIYNWNRKYPSDMVFPMTLLMDYKVKESYEFVGNSHDLITKTIYVRGI
ncbi:MAG: hypothetical protein RR630_01145 [Coprobacillus sp.]